MKKPRPELGELIDKVYELDQKIKAAEAQVGLLKKKRAKRELKLLATLQKSKLDKAAGKRGQAAITKRDIFSIKDPRQFQKYVKKHNAFDLYQNRIAQRALQARLEDGAVVPGTAKFTKVSVSVRKRG